MVELGPASAAVESVLSACFRGSLCELRQAVRGLLCVDSPDIADLNDDASLSCPDGTFSCLELSALESLRDSKEHTVAHIAAAGGNLEVLQFLLTSLPALAHAHDENGENAFFYAIRAAAGRVDLCTSGGSFLSSALLLLGHCGPDCISKSGASALHVACELGALDVCRFLVEHHAEVDVFSEDYGTPLTVSVIRGYVDVVEFLLSHGANADGFPSSHCAEGCAPRACRFPPPLVFACSSVQSRVADLLLSAGASVSATDAEGWTALHCAAESGCAELVRKLVDRGADCNVAVQGKTPYHLALSNGHSGVAAILRDLTDAKRLECADEPAHTVVGAPLASTSSASSDEYECCEDTFAGSTEELERLVCNLRDEGRTFVSNKDYESATQSYSRAICLLSSRRGSHASTLAIMYSNRSHTHLLRGKISRARRDAESCISANPDWPKGYFRLAAVEKACGNDVDYLHNLFEAYKRDPNDTGMRDLFQREFLRVKGSHPAM